MEVDKGVSERSFRASRNVSINVKWTSLGSSIAPQTKVHQNEVECEWGVAAENDVKRRGHTWDEGKLRRHCL